MFPKPINIRTLHHFLYHFVYSSEKYDSQKLTGVLRTRIKWEDARTFFEEESISSIKRKLYDALVIYADTFITLTDDNGFKEKIPLLPRLTWSDDTLFLEHSNYALGVYLHRADEITEISNFHLLSLFIKSFKASSDILYSYMNKGYTNIIDIETLTNDFPVYRRHQIMNRVIVPAEKRIKELYDSGDLPFYITATPIYILGRNSKNRIQSVKINVIDEVSILRQTTHREEYIEYLEEQLMCLFPIDYPFAVEEIKEKDPAKIEEIYLAIKYIAKDPIIFTKPLEKVVSMKMKEKFNIEIQR